MMLVIILSRNGTTLVLTHITGIRRDEWDAGWLFDHRDYDEPRRIGDPDVLRMEVYSA